MPSDGPSVILPGIPPAIAWGPHSRSGKRMGIQCNHAEGGWFDFRSVKVFFEKETYLTFVDIVWAYCIFVPAIRYRYATWSLTAVAGLVITMEEAGLVPLGTLRQKE